MRTLMFLILIVLLILPVAARAEKMLVAVIDLEAKGVSKIVSSAVTDIIRSEMVKTGLFTVVERSQMSEILKEQGFQMTGCTDQSCAVQLGKLLSAQKILVGEINRVGQALMITVRIVDVEKGSSDFAANEKSPTEDDVDKAAMAITKSLAENIVQGNQDYFTPKKTAGGYYTRALFPGWAQFYTDHDTKGYVYMGSFMLATGFAAFTYLNYADAAKAYDAVPGGADQSEFDKKFKAKKDAAGMFVGAAGIMGAVFLVNWIDVLLFSKPDSSNKTAFGGQHNYVAFNAGYLLHDPRPEKAMRVSCGIRF